MRWKKYCCDEMKYYLELKCPKHKNMFDCPDNTITQTRKEYGLIIHDGGSSVIKIKFCPWCGKKL